MRFLVDLAGIEAEWEFLDGFALDRWLETRPWVEDGGVRLARVASIYVSQLVSAVEARAYGYDAGTSGVVPRRVAAWEPDEPLRVSIARAFGIGVEGTLREIADRVANVLRQGSPSLLLIEPANKERLAAHVAEGDELVELLAKMRHTTLAILVLCTSARHAPRSVFELAVGLPRLTVTAIDDDSARWQAYVHLRLAWECAGNLADTTYWWSEACARVKPGQDGDLEAVLNRCALERFANISNSERQMFTKYLRGFDGRPRAQAYIQEANLAELDFIWRPPGERRLQPAAWAARAALQNGEGGGPARSLLRGALVCQPLCRELLFRCFEIEAREHTACWTNRPLAAQPSPKSLEYWEWFQRASSRSAAIYYPPNCPARPTNAWDLASFGELVRLQHPDPAKAPALYEVTELRNALAHGHYVSWASVSKWRSIERQLGR